jgi:hypothetical protein
LHSARLPARAFPAACLAERNVIPSRFLRFVPRFPQLVALRRPGAWGSATVAESSASLSGSGRLDLGQVHGESLDVNVNGSGGVRGSGEVRAVHVRLHGSGSVDLAGLRSESADLSSTGSGDIFAAATQKVSAEATGSGRITVHGNPAQVSVTGKHVNVGI